MTKLAFFNLPDVGEGLTEAEIVSWKVNAGDTVGVNQIIVEIETAKSLVELPCPFAGVVSELMAKEGDTVEVGKPIISVTVPDDANNSAITTSIPVIAENAASAHQAVADAAASVAAEAKNPSLVGYGVSNSVANSRRRRAGAVNPPVAPGAGPGYTNPSAPATTAIPVIAEAAAQGALRRPSHPQLRPLRLAPPPAPQVGVGAFVQNARGYVLVVQERTGPAARPGFLKLPTGLLDQARHAGGIWGCRPPSESPGRRLRACCRPVHCAGSGLHFRP
jgi:pyruvate dehydrogenase E2 component (dihydrolipoamide acetyltransferase)